MKDFLKLLYVGEKREAVLKKDHGKNYLKFFFRNVFFFQFKKTKVVDIFNNFSVVKLFLNQIFFKKEDLL